MTRNLEEFNNAFEGKTAFIVGSGPSLANADLSPISRYLTITVNSGCLAFPDADFFLSDDWSTSRWSYFLNDLKQSQTTVLLYELKLGSWVSTFGDRSVLFRHRKGYHITDEYSHTEKENHICEARTSVGSAIHVAHIMGCNKIVLLGIDCCRLHDKRYFWEFDNKYAVSRVDGVNPSDFRRVRHKGRNSDIDLVQIQKYWNLVGNQLSGKCNIYNASDLSTLTVFPKTTIENVTADDYTAIR